MKKVKKYKYIIVIIIITLMMIFKISSVSQADYEYTKDKYGNVINLGRKVENSRISVSQAKKDKKWWITFNDYTLHTNKGNIYCVQKGNDLLGKGATYKVKDIIYIDGLDVANEKGSGLNGMEANAKLAYMLEEAKTIENRANLIWKYMEEWQNELKSNEAFEASANILKINMQSEEVTLTQKQKDIVDAAKEYVKMYNEKSNGKIKVISNAKTAVCESIGENTYYKIGPIRYEFTPNLKSIEVKNQNGKKVNLSFVMQDGKKTSVDNIISNTKFYIYIPYNSENTSVTITLTTKKPKYNKYTAKIIILKSGPQDWQNLIAVESDKKSVSGYEDQDYFEQNLTGSLKIQKVDKNNHQMNLDGAKFMVSNMDTGWVYQNADGSINTTWNVDWKNNPPTSFIPGQTIKNLPAGDYQITEVGVPNNYEVNENCKFFVNENGKVTEGTMEKYNNSFAAKGIKVGSGTTVNIQIENKQKYISISGYVWKDGTDGKTTSRNNLYYKTDKEDQLLKGVKVRLMRWRKDANGTIYYDPNKDMEEVKSTWTNDNGEYKFEQVEVDDLGRSFVVFEYNGMKYKSIEAIYNAANGSKAVEHNWRNRNTFDSQYSTISSDNNGNSVANNKNNEKIEYDFGSHTATFKGKDDTYNEKFKVSAETNFGNEHKVDGYYLNNEFKPGTGQTSINNVNLGLCERDLPDLAVQKDVQNVQVEINGYGHTYNYDRKETLEKQNNEDAFNVGVKFGSKYTEGYELPIYESDSNYINKKDPSKELKVYITYKVRLKNQATTIDSKINSLVDYYDSTYEKNGNCDIRINENINDTDKDGKLNSTIEFSKSDYNDKYKKLNINTKGISIGAGETKCIYIQFGLSRTQIASIINDKSEEDRILKNVVEINSYSSYYKGTTNPYGGIDKDSAPGNAVPGDQSTYEDDTDTAPTLKLEVKEARKLTGKVFLDSTNGTLMTGQIREGDGEYKDGEEGIKDITVTLKPINEDPSYVEYSEKTNENGDFTISGFIPNEYEVIYTWGGQELKNGDKITLDKYKGTAYKERERYTLTGPLWYRQNANKRLTDAIDNYERRQEIDKKYKSIDHTTESIINNIQNEKMNSTTPKMSIRIENMRKRRKNNYIIIR